MPDPKPKPEQTPGRLRRNAVSGALGLGILASVLIVLIVAIQSYRDRDTVIKNEKASLLRLAQIIAVETDDMFNQIEFFFKAADLWLSVHPKADPRYDLDFRRLVDEFRAIMNGRVDIRLVSETGGLFYIPSDGPEPRADVRDRSYYKAQMSPETKGFYVADPVKSRVTGMWGIPISYPLSSRNAGIAVIFAAIEMPDLEALYEKVRPKPGGSISLIRRDGQFLARIPFDEEYMSRRVAEDGAAWWSAIQQSEILVMRATSTDHAERIIATKPILDPDLAVNVSARMEDALAPWRDMTRWRIALTLAFVAAIGLVSMRLLAALRKLDAAQSELAAGVARLRESDATKDKLFSILAHDLRGPIGGICNLLDTVAQDLASMSADELQKYLSALRVGAWNTYQLLENILAWSRSKRGDMPFHPAVGPVLPLVEECVQVYALAMGDKGLSVRIDVEGSLEARADPDLLKVVLRNLVSNAIKFSNAGGRIDISGRRSGPSDGPRRGVRVTVRDQGVGMDARTKAALFAPGGPGSRNGTAREGGSGLGLVLCKDIMALHGGEIGAESGDGAGSAITFFLPDASGDGPP